MPTRRSHGEGTYAHSVTFSGYRRVLWLALLFASGCWGASLTGMPGIAGLQLGTVPGPGYYLFDTFFSYSSSDFRDRHGNKVTEFMGKPVSFNVVLDANLPRFCGSARTRC